MRHLNLILIPILTTVALCAVSALGASDLDEFKIKREQVFSFTQKPILSIAGDDVTVTFESKGFCDVTVAIENSQGQIIRHLASGVLGPNAPAPFQKNSKKQTLTWDGKDDQGKYIDDKDRVMVRVSLGLKPRYEKPLFWEPKKQISQAAPLIRAAPEGVYIFDSWGTDHLRLFDHDGTFQRTIYPFPAAQLKNVKGLDLQTFPQDGKQLPLKKGYQGATLLTSGSTAVVHDCFKTGKGIGAYAMDVRGDRIALAGLQLNRLATDGSSASQNIYGPKTWLLRPGQKEFSHYQRSYVCPTSSAISPDGTWLYLAGYAWRIPRNVGCLNSVLRMKLDGDQEPQVFLGNLDPGKHGTDNKHFTCASSVACDSKGRVYVSDYMNDRVQVYSPEGAFLKSIKTPKPAVVRIHPKTDEIYVFSWVLLSMHLIKRGSWGTVTVKPTLTHFGALDKPSQIAEYDLPLPQKERFFFYRGVDPHAIWYSADIDFYAKTPTIWLGRRCINNQERGLPSGDGGKSTAWSKSGIRLLQMQKGKLIQTDDFGADTVKSVTRATPPIYFRQRLFVNPKTEKLYVGEGDSGVGNNVSTLLEIDPETSAIKPYKLPFAAEDICFDQEGLIYLRTHWEILRYEKTEQVWREVPWDYGEEAIAKGGGGNPLSAISLLPTPSVRPMCYFQNGMSISPKGHLAVSCVNYSAQAMVRSKGYNARAFMDGKQPEPSVHSKNRTKKYVPSLFPGRARWNEIHVWDRHGKIIHKDAMPGLHMHNGLAIDKDDNLYAMASGTRVLDGKRYHDRSSGTLVKARPAKAKFTSSKTVAIALPPELRPKRAPDMWGRWMIGDSWIDGAEWLYGGVNFVGWNMNDKACGCCRATFELDFFARSFAPEIGHLSIAVLDTNGNLILRVGQYGNADDGVPLVPHPNLKQARSIGGDEVALFWGAYLATHSDRRLFIADPGNGRIVSVKLGYHTEAKLALKDVDAGGE